MFEASEEKTRRRRRRGEQSGGLKEGTKGQRATNRGGRERGKGRRGNFGRRRLAGLPVPKGWTSGWNLDLHFPKLN